MCSHPFSIRGVCFTRYCLKKEHRTDTGSSFIGWFTGWGKSCLSLSSLRTKFRGRMGWGREGFGCTGEELKRVGLEWDGGGCVYGIWVMKGNGYYRILWARRLLFDEARNAEDIVRPLWSSPNEAMLSFWGLPRLIAIILGSALLSSEPIRARSSFNCSDLQNRASPEHHHSIVHIPLRRSAEPLLFSLRIKSRHPLI